MSCFIELLRQHHQAFEERYGRQLSGDKHKAIRAMLSCKTSQQRCSQWMCQHCQHHEQHPLSCGHRHCPQCQHTTTIQWLARQTLKLLPVHYFMVTFTLPYELRALARSQPKALYQSMFRVAASVLKDFAQRKHMGELGFTAVLHTHSRQRALHPHLHIIVASGGYDSANNNWIKGKGKYLFNAFALASVWRARLLDVIKHHDTLTLTHKQNISIPKKWVVDCRKVGYGLPALQYLSRYLYRGVLPDKDIMKTTDTTVTFKYKDGQTQKTCYRTLPTLEFLWLILQHILPKGLQRVRDYGFLRGNAKKLLWKIMLVLMSTRNWVAPKQKTIKRKAKRLCPCCKHEMQLVGITRTT